MVTCKIVIQSLEDAKNGMGLIDKLTHEEVEKIRTAKETTIGILEKGTKEGQPVVMFILEMADGTYSMSQITGRMFEALIGAYKGAVQRFQEGEARKN